MKWSSAWYIPEREECLLGESGAGGGDGEHEGGDAEGGVDGHEAGAERGRGALAAEQQQEAEEAHHELKGRIILVIFFRVVLLEEDSNPLSRTLSGRRTNWKLASDTNPSPARWPTTIRNEF